MTMINDVEMKCAVCGKTSSQPVLMSTNQMGYVDLDLRPAPMQRDTMNVWILECPHCGYVSGSIEDPIEIEKEYLKTEEYLTCSNYSFKRDLAKRFYRKYLISKQADDVNGQFFNLIHCAWVCDDAQDELAVEMRKKSLEFIDSIIEQEDNPNLIVMKADILRRAGEFERVISEFENTDLEEEILIRIINFEIEKAKEKDAECYNVGDVVNQ